MPNKTLLPYTASHGLSNLSPPMSPSLSPPVSPAKSHSMSGLSPISGYSDRWASADSYGLSQFNPDSLTYKDVLTELMTSLESMNVNQASPPSNTNRRNPQWVDVSFNNGDDQQKFVLFPSPPTPSPSGSRNFQTPGEFSGKSLKIDDKKLIQVCVSPLRRIESLIEKQSKMKSTKIASTAQVPTSFRHVLRACLHCRLVKTDDQGIEMRKLPHV